MFHEAGVIIYFVLDCNCFYRFCRTYLRENAFTEHINRCLSLKAYHKASPKVGIVVSCMYTFTSSCLFISANHCWLIFAGAFLPIKQTELRSQVPERSRRYLTALSKGITVQKDGPN